MAKFVLGAMKFQREVFPGKKEMFERLSAGQSPEALFITCSDSRIETGLITQSDPGDLFICRNAGNIVPPHTNQTGGMTASIEFAVGVLRVPNIVVCGHTECGAMKGAMNRDGLKCSTLRPTRRWRWPWRRKTWSCTAGSTTSGPAPWTPMTTRPTIGSHSMPVTLTMKR